MKFGLSRVGEITELLRAFIKSEQQNTFEIYQQQGRLVVQESQTSEGLIPEDLGAHESEDENSAEEIVNSKQKSELRDLKELKAMMAE